MPGTQRAVDTLREAEGRSGVQGGRLGEHGEILRRGALRVTALVGDPRNIPWQRKNKAKVGPGPQNREERSRTERVSVRVIGEGVLGDGGGSPLW